MKTTRYPLLSAAIWLIFSVTAVPFTAAAMVYPGFSAVTESDSVPAAPRPVGWSDVADWKQIPGSSATLSNDGNWFAYWYAPNEGDAEVVVRSTSGTETYRWPVGDPATTWAFNQIQFSYDSHYLAFTTYPTFKERENTKDRTKLPKNGLHVVDLSDTSVTSFENVKRFDFSGEAAGWLAVHLETPAPARDDKEAGRGTNLLLTELKTGSTLSLGNVSAFGFNKSGTWLAWIVDAHNKAGNGIQLRNMRTGVIQPIESDKARYMSLNWHRDGHALAALKEVEHDDWEDKLHQVIGVRGFDKNNPQKVVFDPHSAGNFPDSMTVSPNRTPYWNDGITSLLFGIHPAKAKPVKDTAAADSAAASEKGTENGKNGGKTAVKPSKTDKKTYDRKEKPDLVLWHWEDEELQSRQQRTENADKNFSYLSVYHVNTSSFVRLADDDLRSISPNPMQRYGVGRNDDPYRLEASLTGQSYADFYVVDFVTGERFMLLEKLKAYWGAVPSASPDGTKLLYYTDGHYFSYDITRKTTTNLTEPLPARFVDSQNDRNQPLWPTPAFGWSSDSRNVLIRDEYALWLIPADGKRATNLTPGASEIKLRFLNRYRFDPDERGIDLKKPMYVYARNENTKETGFFRIDNARSGARSLIFGPYGYGSLTKALNSDVYLYTRQHVTETPDYYVTRSRDLSGGQKITEIYPEAEHFLLSPGEKMVTYVSDKGDTLQGVIYLPAGYEEGKSYPTVVYIYERLTQNRFSYSRPSFPGGGFNRAMYTSNGYAVFMPDITYTMNDPGMSAVWCVLPALDAAVATGIVDNDNVAIHGHSWGGYQTSFLITQTDRFKAAVAGAPLTNMISMYGVIYWNSGSWNGAIFEGSQGRLNAGYWELWDAYKRNSPVYFVERVNTPLLLMHNDKDGAVDFTQGVEYYNVLRRLQKPVVMLQYKGENHGLTKRANQVDYARRMMEFLDHHLKGAEAPDWYRNGVKHLDIDEHLDNRKAW